MTNNENQTPESLDDVERHNGKMAKKKLARDKIMAGKTDQKGLIIVHTGKGKGKSSSAFGMIFRCIAHEMPCAVVQFIKGSWQTGEKKLLKQNFSNECLFFVSGDGFTWDTQNRETDIKSANSGWEKAKDLIRDKKINIDFFIIFQPIDLFSLIILMH